MNSQHILRLSVIVSGVALLSLGAPSVLADDAVPQHQTVSQANTLTSQKDGIVNTIDQDLNQLQTIKEEVKGTDAEKAVTTAIETADKLKSSLKFNPETIYDINSIGARVEALSDAVQAIVFATTQLSHKVDQAHIDMGFAITKLVIRIADPFTSVDAIKAQVQAIADLEKKVLTYADLKASDRATIYVKSSLDKVIWNTRFERDQKVLGIKSFAVYNTLNQAITHAVGVQLNPNVTVAQVDQEVVALQNALTVALN
ncbi:CAMP factor family pore-forming toxin [Streptococcus iniae]|nr:CAMP factor family pore-forming toxin [Streptococcus iniae]WNZ96630.1 CAMP factor family pore-forming toxin [Streptococcus iniae]